MKLENKCKRKGKRVLSALEEKNLAKELAENDKKNLIWALTNWIESEFLKTFWKVSWTCENQVFKKLSIRFSIDRKLGSINRKCFDWSSINRASIETNRGWPKILIAISIDWKTYSIDWNSGKNKFLKNKAILCRNSSKHWILWIKCMSMRWNIFQKHKFWTQFSQN